MGHLCHVVYGAPQQCFPKRTFRREEFLLQSLLSPRPGTQTLTPSSRLSCGLYFFSLWLDLRLPLQHAQADEKPSPGTNQATGRELQGEFVFSVFSQVVVFPCKRGMLTPLKPGGRRGTYKSLTQTLRRSRQEHLFDCQCRGESGDDDRVESLPSSHCIPDRSLAAEGQTLLPMTL